MSRYQFVCAGFLALAAAPVWPQVENVAAQPVPVLVGLDLNADSADDRMLAPPPVSGQSYPVAPTSQERSNYLRGGFAFVTAYSDNVLGSADGHPVSDVSYSIAPTVGLDKTTSRLHWLLNYAPGFTFYQRTNS